MSLSGLIWGVLWLLMLPIYILQDLEQARWLPWWRRYAPSVLVGAVAVAYFADAHDRLRDALFLTWFIATWSNRYTANKNRRNNHDCKKLEAQSERLTEVQTAALRREVAEVRA